MSPKGFDPSYNWHGPWPDPWYGEGRPSYRQYLIGVRQPLKMKIGDKAVVVANTTAHQFPNGTKVVIVGLNLTNSPPFYSMKRLDTNVQSSAYEADLKRLAQTKAELEEEVKGLQSKVEDVLLKIRFLVENDLKEFDDSEFKIYKALIVVESSKSRIDKARALAEIIKG